MLVTMSQKHIAFLDFGCGLEVHVHARPTQTFVRDAAVGHVISAPSWRTLAGEMHCECSEICQYYSSMP